MAVSEAERRAAVRAATKRQLERQRALGLCQQGSCPNPARPGRTTCQECTDKLTAYKRARREAMRLGGAAKTASKEPAYMVAAIAALPPLAKLITASGHCARCGGRMRAEGRGEYACLMCGARAYARVARGEL